MKEFPLILSALLVGVMCVTLHAQTVATFGKSIAVARDSDVDASGTTALAFDYADNLNSTGPTTVNGVKFGSTAAQDGYSLAVTNATNYTATYTGYLASNPLTLSTDYGHILNGGIYTPDQTPLDITFSGLTKGGNYLVQFFCYDDRAPYHRTLTLKVKDSPDASAGFGALKAGSGDPSDFAPGTYVKATFVAADSTVTFELSGQGVQLNAVNLRVESDLQ